MASVVNIAAIASRMQQLGWSTISVSEVVGGLSTAGIPATEFIAYLDALLASPGGLNDQTIAGCAPTDAAKITGYLKNHQAVAT